MADSIAIFGEGTFEEQACSINDLWDLTYTVQIQELVNYLVRNKQEEERVIFIRPFQDALKGAKPLDEDEERRRKVFSMVLAETKSLGEGSEKEIEGFFNLINAHLLSLYTPDSPETKLHVSALIAIFSASEQGLLKYRLLSNLFNALPRKSPLRLTVYSTLLELAIANEELDALQLTRTDVEKWLREWDVPGEQKSVFLKTLADAYEKLGQKPKAYEYSIAYVRSLTPGSPTAESAAVELIATALRLPFVFDFDPLFKIDAVVALKGHDVFSLLQIFLNDGLVQFNEWKSTNPDAISKHQLDGPQLERKIRLLTLASVGFQNIGQDLPYNKLAEAIQVPSNEVERWVIDVIRTGLLSGKLSQTSQTLHITRAKSRSFERDQWEALEKRLLAWKTGIAGVLDVVAQARKQAPVITQTPIPTA
ncbi:Eukaryotic translation initiation factor 3 subunit M [Mycena indigotica]|uniref:Eukaryotic translation initiation factor 3 subunit M n=1 Tax=Mycena indigotica TaxID=2126181 RepID=A0A8H6SNF3_9AGAR|nr:Eukaryotic translation initiation factor 3 subunit M [Mycena indigotica]KAF7302070.1 Eukaryotic translation initiation factor 3 subunit M [Mycena indigotica]